MSRALHQDFSESTDSHSCDYTMFHRCQNNESYVILLVTATGADSDQHTEAGHKHVAVHMLSEAFSS